MGDLGDLFWFGREGGGVGGGGFVERGADWVGREKGPGGVGSHTAAVAVA